MGSKREKKLKMWLYIFVILLIIDILVPDPVPFIDEIILMFASTVTGVKLLKAEGEY